MPQGGPDADLPPGFSRAGAGGLILPGASVHHGTPTWLTDLAHRIPDVAPSEFSRFLPPDEGGRESAVLILFGPPPEGAAVDGEHVVLIERSHTMRRQPGQIAFPGGMRDVDDVDDVATALREANEEVGIDPAGVEVLQTLPPLFLPPAEIAVTPVLGWWERPGILEVRDSNEVQEVLSVPVARLRDPAARFTAQLPNGYSAPAFDLDDLFLWGFTAGLLSRVLDLAGLSEDWDESVVRPVPERFLRR